MDIERGNSVDKNKKIDINLEDVEWRRRSHNTGLFEFLNEENMIELPITSFSIDDDLKIKKKQL